MKSSYAEDVLPPLLRWREEGLKTTLVTLVNIEGSSPRPLGSQMAVAENGDSIGVITGGCAEAAIVFEAQEAMKSGENRCVRYGEGSPYMDIRLPCGSGIDVFFDACFSDEHLTKLLSAQKERRQMTMNFDVEALTASIHESKISQQEFAEGKYAKLYNPPVRLLAAGKGFILPYVAQFAKALSIETHAYSPEEETLEHAAPFCTSTTHLTNGSGFVSANIDRWTAIVTLFHEHEWEASILSSALKSECFYLGALGSRRTHQERLEVLRMQGVDETSFERIRGPVGLDIKAKSPPEIAVSIVAEIIETQRLKGLA
ncbi:XdhC family protein [Hyphococcus flavus]|uniref:XdhC family protein n=1 Tax=Hyphococcus flavus TaxID=1866326 RepID=A0AAF0CGB3_9PROT|nr:XdhC family protein [Hyphococcus flavus]WDI30462.1 XdhC family protein [Hyphococcus flavus]